MSHPGPSSSVVLCRHNRNDQIIKYHSPRLWQVYHEHFVDRVPLPWEDIYHSTALFKCLLLEKYDCLRVNEIWKKTKILFQSETEILLKVALITITPLFQSSSYHEQFLSNTYEHHQCVLCLYRIIIHSFKVSLTIILYSDGNIHVSKFR